MKIKVSLTSRASSAMADAIYEGETITVLPGGKISKDFALHIRGGKKAKSYRENLEYVDIDGNIIKACVFKSPSTAAQFVVGRSENGYRVWKTIGGKSLGEYLKEKGLR